jgi:2-dehydropantoate 2-reductase
MAGAVSAVFVWRRLGLYHQCRSVYNIIEGEMMEIAIYGAGSMGTVLGAFLCRSGFSPDLISHDQAHITALKTDGAKIGGTVLFSTPPFDGKEGRGSALLPPQMNKKYDIIFLLTKQSANVAAAQMLKDFLSPAGIICTMQNGIPEQSLSDILGEDRVTGCICIWGAGKTAPGAADLTSEPGSMRFVIDNRDLNKALSPMLEKICPVNVEHNFIGARWSKLLINAGFSGLSAVTGWDFGKIAADRRSKMYVLYVIKECIDVCRAAGITIEPVQGKFPAEFMYFKNPVKKFFLSLIMPFAMRHHRSIKSGMLRDLDLKRPCEIEAINGEVCRAGKKHNVPTPVNDRIVVIVHSIERGARQYCPQNLSSLNE